MTVGKQDGCRERSNVMMCKYKGWEKNKDKRGKQVKARMEERNGRTGLRVRFNAKERRWKGENNDRKNK